VRHPALLPLLAIFAGVAFAAAVPSPPGVLPVVALLILYLLALWTFLTHRPACVAFLLASFACAAWLLASATNRDATRPALLGLFARLPADSGPVVVAGRLRQDASPGPAGGATLHLDVVAPPRTLLGGIVVSVSGTLAGSRLDDWRAGRTVQAPVLLREPTVYRDPGVRDERLALARRRIHLFASVKSGALVDVTHAAGWWGERCADVRAFARRAVGRAVGRWSAQSAAIVVAILIGDRAGLDADVERRLQEAGTYHVIAISGGNIAILAGCLLGTLRLLAVRPKLAAWLTIAVLVAYADVVGAGASVNRATLMAVTYLVAMMFDQRGVPTNALLFTAAVLLCSDPLSLYDVAFALTCGATLGILVAGVRFSRALPARWWLHAPAALLLASASAETALLPIAALAFSRVTFAGLFLNFLAIPMMGVAQLAGMAVLPLALFSAPLADAAGWLAHIGAAGLVWSGSLVDVLPMLVWRVPGPPAGVVVAYYMGWVLLLIGERKTSGRKMQDDSGVGVGQLRRFAFGVDTVRGSLCVTRRPLRLAVRSSAICLLVLSSVWILWSPLARWRGSRPTGLLRATFLDVGQADSILVRFPDGRAWLVDAGGSRAGGSFDVGGRVIEPALWHYDVFALDRFVLTHGDPDHLGGAPALLHDFRVRGMWEGVDVPRDGALQHVRQLAIRRGADHRFVRAGDELDVGGARVRVWHPPPPDWERQKIRNDDSIVLDLRFGDVSLVLTGDIGKDVERGLVRQLAAAPLAVLKVPHHGSAASSSPPFLEALRPRVAVFTVGAASRSSPSMPTVVARYTSIGAEVVKTGEDGAVEVETDGKEVRVTTFTGRRLVLRAGSRQ
jgi:competence protein ComEC